jgi:hypothetical protein
MRQQFDEALTAGTRGCGLVGAVGEACAAQRQHRRDRNRDEAGRHDQGNTVVRRLAARDGKPVLRGEGSIVTGTRSLTARRSGSGKVLHGGNPTHHQ